MNLARAGPGLSNTRWKNLTLDDAIEVLGGRRRIASGRAIDVKQEHRRIERLVDVEHIVEVVEVVEVAEEERSRIRRRYRRNHLLQSKN